MSPPTPRTATSPHPVASAFGVEIPTAAARAEAKKEILALFSEEPDDEHEWTEQDIYEQARKIIQKYC